MSGQQVSRINYSDSSEVFPSTHVLTLLSDGRTLRGERGRTLDLTQTADTTKSSDHHEDPREETSEYVRGDVEESIRIIDGVLGSLGLVEVSTLDGDRGVGGSIGSLQSSYIS